MILTYSLGQQCSMMRPRIPPQKITEIEITEIVGTRQDASTNTTTSRDVACSVRMICRDVIFSSFGKEEYP